jgi:hypothetical protein
MTDVDHNELFSARYSEARNRFLAAARSANAHLDAFENPIRGAGGENLFTDVALLGPDAAPSVLVLVSGTHGVEGFCGSGIQTGLLREGITEQLPPEVAVVMVHALNPYGFSHLRRVNEDNIDLNRNFVDHNQTHPENTAYDALYDAINPRADSRLRIDTASLRILLGRAFKGKKTLKAAITEGQYTHPTGLFYGGTCEAWSHLTLRSICQRYLSNAQRIAFVDIHTGLGPFGYGELICRFPLGSTTFNRMAVWWGKRVKPAEISEAASPRLSGTTTYAISEIHPGTEVSPVTLEFGTYGVMTVLRKLQIENWYHHNREPICPQFQASKEALKQIFYPPSPKWRTMVWKQGLSVVIEAMKGLERGKEE